MLVCVRPVNPGLAVSRQLLAVSNGKDKTKRDCGYFEALAPFVSPPSRRLYWGRPAPTRGQDALDTAGKPVPSKVEGMPAVRNRKVVGRC